MNDKLTLLQHPILHYKLTVLRDKDTTPARFRQTMSEMSRLVAYEATKDLLLGDVDIETPLQSARVKTVQEDVTVVSIMRAGNAMLEGLLSLLPFASAGHIGIYRDKFIENTVEYYFRLPKNVKDRRVLLVDPLLATGDTMLASLDRLKQYEVGPIRVLCLLTSQEGYDKIHHFHPDVEVFAVSLEPELNEKGFLLPGIGDAGNRLYNTEG